MVHLLMVSIFRLVIFRLYVPLLIIVLGKLGWEILCQSDLFYHVFTRI